MLDAVVVGSGPNGLAAAIVLASAGLEVEVHEAEPVPGGGCRTAELTLPGYRHDVCSAVHPLAAASPFFTWFDLPAHGVRLCRPEVAVAHPLDSGRAAAVAGSPAETAALLGTDASAYERLFGPLVTESEALIAAVLSSMRRVPSRPVPALRFAVLALRSAASLAGRFHTEDARALLAGIAAHSMEPLERSGTGGIAVFLGLLAHAVGWPVAAGGSQAITDSLVAALEAAGGRVVTGHRVRRLDELPRARVTMLDLTPRGLLGLAGGALPAAYRRRLARYRFGPGVCKVDWALAGPVPWTAEVCRRAGTVHLGGSFEEIAGAERDVAVGHHPERPYVLCAQPGVVDRSRAPQGNETLWTYCHVPAGSNVDMSEAIAGQIERFAPGFRDLVLARRVMTARDEEAHNENYVGGDIAAGAQGIAQTLFRPVARLNPYGTPLSGVYLCSASTPPGPGVHGRSGELAARRALRDHFGVRSLPDAPPAARRDLPHGTAV